MFEYTFNFADVELTAKAVAKDVVNKWNSTKVFSIIYVCANGHRSRFNYYSPEEVANVNDLANALYCFFSDAISYENSKDLDDFASEFGYTSIKECLEAWKGCKAASDKIKRLGLDAFEVADILANDFDC